MNGIKTRVFVVEYKLNENDKLAKGIAIVHHTNEDEEHITLIDAEGFIISNASKIAETWIPKVHLGCFNTEL